MAHGWDADMRRLSLELKFQWQCQLCKVLTYLEHNIHFLSRACWSLTRKVAAQQDYERMKDEKQKNCDLSCAQRLLTPTLGS